MTPVQINIPHLTTEELAARWQVHAGTIRTGRSNNTLPLPFIRIGGSIRYRIEDVIEYEKMHREGGAV